MRWDQTPSEFRDIRTALESTKGRERGKAVTCTSGISSSSLGEDEAGKHPCRTPTPVFWLPLSLRPASALRPIKLESGRFPGIEVLCEP